MRQMIRVALPGLLVIGLAGCPKAFEVKVAVPEQEVRARAAQSPPPNWKVPLEDKFVQQIEFLGRDRLFVTLRSDESEKAEQEAILVDTRTGDVAWRYTPGEERSGSFQSVLLLRERILLQFNEGGTSTLVALDAETGLPTWEITTRAPEHAFLPIPGAGVLAVIELEPDAARIEAVRLTDGEHAWRRRYAGSGYQGGAPFPVVTLDGLFTFYQGTERIDGRDGSAVWRREKVVLDRNSPPPQVEGESLYLLDVGGLLHRLSTEEGRAVWVHRMAYEALEINNIHPAESRVYVRGAYGSDVPKPHVTRAFRKSDGEPLWEYDAREPLVSNMIEHDGRVYAATPTSVVALDTTNGGRYFAASVTNSGRTYPVHLRHFDDRVVFIGELIVSAVNARTGREIYTHGFDPVETGISLTTLDAHIEKLEERSREEGDSGLSDDLLDWSEFALEEARQYQNLSNQYSQIASQKWSEYMYYGDGLSADMAYYDSMAARSQATINNAFAEAQSTIAMHMAVQGLNQKLIEAGRAMARERLLAQQRFRRSAILTAYTQMESREYAYRPNLDYDSPTDQFLRLSIIHLPTGRIRHTTLAPPHGPFGLWSVVDFGKGLAYHNSIGMDPAEYRQTEQGSMLDGVRYLETFLISQPVEIPR